MGVKDSSEIGFFLIGGRNVLGSRTTVDFDPGTPPLERTTLGATAVERRFNSVASASLSQAGYFDEDTGAANEALFGAAGRAEQIICLGECGNAVGIDVACLAGALVGSYKRGMKVKEFHTATAEMVSSGAVDDDARIIAPHTARTDATWVTTAVDHGASSALGLAAYLQVSALTLGGYTNVVIVLQHSADASAWVDLVTFTAVALAPAAQRKVIVAGGTINRHLRASASYTGAGTGQSVTALLCAQWY
jgi:hypothetical protein